jgi:hypothetical protein
MFLAASSRRAELRLTRICKSPLPLISKPSVRYLTATNVSKSPRRNGTLLFAVLSSSLVGGVLGYTLATTALGSSQHDYLESPKYGSPRDFEEGIKELRQVFAPRDIISTDPEVLEIHGVSTMNSYHLGW